MVVKSVRGMIFEPSFGLLLLSGSSSTLIYVRIIEKILESPVCC